MLFLLLVIPRLVAMTRLVDTTQRVTIAPLVCHGSRQILETPPFTFTCTSISGFLLRLSPAEWVVAVPWERFVSVVDVFRGDMWVRLRCRIQSFVSYSLFRRRMLSSTTSIALALWNEGRLTGTQGKRGHKRRAEGEGNQERWL